MQIRVPASTRKREVFIWAVFVLYLKFVVNLLAGVARLLVATDLENDKESDSKLWESF